MPLVIAPSRIVLSANCAGNIGFFAPRMPPNAMQSSDEVGHTTIGSGTERRADQLDGDAAAQFPAYDAIPPEFIGDDAERHMDDENTVLDRS